MAPPAHRRTGTNKKAQMGLFAGYVVAGLGALFGVALLTISFLRPETFNGLRTMAADVASPGTPRRTEVMSPVVALAASMPSRKANACTGSM